MNKLLPVIIFFVLANVSSLPQRDRTPGGRRPESQIPLKTYRIEKGNRDSKTRNPQKTVVQQQQSPQKTKPPIKEHIYMPEKYKQSYQFDCLVNYPGKYNFPDRIYQIEGIDLILQKFFEDDLDGAIELLNFLIEGNQFGPELFFLRGIAYINRKSESKIDDYFKAKSDFILLKGWEPNFPQLTHYLALLDYYLYGKRPITEHIIK